MARKATYTSAIESEETAEVVVRQSPAEIEAAQPTAAAQPVLSYEAASLSPFGDNQRHLNSSPKNFKSCSSVMPSTAVSSSPVA